MACGAMNRKAYWIIAVIICFQNGYIHAGPTLKRQSQSYLPPFALTDQSDSVQQASSVVESKQAPSNSYTATTYSTNHISPDNFQTSPQLSNHKSISSYTRTYYNSYAPQPSGIGKQLPQVPTPPPLPSLIPKSVLDQFISTTTPRNLSNRDKSGNARISAQSSKRSAKSGLDSSEAASPADHASQSVIMFDSPPAVLTLSQNDTIYAAKLLASSLLQATADGPVDKLDGFNVVDPKSNEQNKLNSTDVVIVKAQKNAYIIPMKLPIGDSNRNPVAIDDLYNMRDKLNRAYTINQFIFIIKPERINFLNKLI